MTKTFFKKTKAASKILAQTPEAKKNQGLLAMARALREQTMALLKANQKDLKNAKRAHLSEANLDRLTLNEKRIEDMALALEALVKLPDPVGEVVEDRHEKNGLHVQKVRIPLGVIGFIYESRPNVTSDAAGLCLKSGNAVILKGGKEAFFSNQAIAKIIKHALVQTKLPVDCVQVLPSNERGGVDQLLKAKDDVDLIIPRGGESLMRRVAAKSKIPVLKHDKGVCHIFIDDSADPLMAEKICLNAKVQRPGVCNAVETLLIHENLRQGFLPALIGALQHHGVEVRAPRDIAKFNKNVVLAKPSDFGREFLGLVVAIKCVASLDEALAHIATYGSLHTEAIVTKNVENAERFLRSVSSSTVLVNASTRLADGGALGLGAEIGISTTKLHAFGPMGLRDLTIGHFIVRGAGQIRS